MIRELLLMLNCAKQAHERLVVVLIMLDFAPVHERILITIDAVVGRHRLNSNFKKLLDQCKLLLTELLDWLFFLFVGYVLLVIF